MPRAIAKVFEGELRGVRFIKVAVRTGLFGLVCCVGSYGSRALASSRTLMRYPTNELN